jgi:hypothetical protein
MKRMCNERLSGISYLAFVLFRGESEGIAEGCGVFIRAGGTETGFQLVVELLDRHKEASVLRIATAAEWEAASQDYDKSFIMNVLKVKRGS